jgi:two-component system cell cycle sensor histidine kinase/response regulator CckA
MIRHHGKRILLVEDDDAFRRGVSLTLSRAGFTVIPCGDVPTAIGVIDSGQPVDLLLSGIVAAREPSLAQIAKARLARLKLLVMGDRNDAGAATTDGAPFLTKPFQPDALLEAVENALG